MAANAPGGPIQHVYRAIRNPKWVKNGVRDIAFLRRPPTDPHPDIHGLSVCYTYEDAKALNFNHGAIRISVAKLTAIGLRIVPHGNHANIQEVPYYTEETMAEALKYANAIIKCCD